MQRYIVLVSVLVMLLALPACGSGPSETTPSATVSPVPATSLPTAAPLDTPSATTTTGDTVQRYPDIVDVQLTPNPDGTFDIAVTVSSPYDTPERYADAWRVLTPAGQVVAERELLHDHANEQPFTRSLTGVTIPADVTTVTVQGRDLQYGYGGTTQTVPVPGR